MKLTPVYQKRMIKEIVIGVLILIIANVALNAINVSGSIQFYANIIILIYTGIKLIPKAMYCSDCGNFLGKELNYSVPCRKCDGNIFSYTQVGAGKTFKHR